MFVAVTFCAVVLAPGVGAFPLVLAAWAVPHHWIQGQSGWAGAIVVGLLILPLPGVGSSVSVRLDTGDQRIPFWGIPINSRPMREPARSALLTLDRPNAPRGWRWCAQQVGSNNADLMVYSFYTKATAWVDVDPKLHVSWLMI